MAWPLEHRWDLSPAQARALQEELRDHVVERDDLGTIEVIAGLDVGFEDGGRTARAAVVTLDAASLETRESAVARRPVGFPYVPGLLSFREIPVLLDALAGLARLPDLLICDGQGRAHPRRFGLACHLGVVTGLPSIGCAKSRLVGTHEAPGVERGSRVPLIDAGEVIGTVLRTRRAVRPVYVSIGHRVSLDTAVRWVLAATPRYRLPETTRHAHRLASGPRALV